MMPDKLYGIQGSAHIAVFSYSFPGSSASHPLKVTIKVGDKVESASHNPAMMFDAWEDANLFHVLFYPLKLII